MKFKDIFLNFTDYVRQRHKKQGADTIIRNFKNHILVFFGDYDISLITKSDIIHWQNYILAKNFKNSFNSILYSCFNDFLEFCIKSGYLSVNLLKEVGTFNKRVEEKNHQVYSFFQFLKFIFYINDPLIKRYFIFLYMYGTRPSEAMALRFSDIENNFIHIQHSIERKGNRCLTTPKNNSSFRYLKIGFFSKFLISKLKKYYTKKYGYFDNSYFVFGGNKPLAPTTIDRYKKRAIECAKLPYITQHEFRHTCATRKIHCNESIDKVSKLLGHSHISTTVDIYLHYNEKNLYKDRFSR